MSAASRLTKRLQLGFRGDERLFSVPPEQPYLLNGGEEKRRREAKENEAVDRLDRAKQLPPSLEMDIGVTEARPCGRI